MISYYSGNFNVISLTFTDDDQIRISADDL